LSFLELILLRQSDVAGKFDTMAATKASVFFKFVVESSLLDASALSAEKSRACEIE